jgi:hypothetical protein
MILALGDISPEMAKWVAKNNAAQAPWIEMEKRMDAAAEQLGVLGEDYQAREIRRGDFHYLVTVSRWPTK